MFPSPKAAEYVFGHTLHNDVFDRGGRGHNCLGNDWLIGSRIDTFAPLGRSSCPRNSAECAKCEHEVRAQWGEAAGRECVADEFTTCSNWPRTAPTS